MLNNYQYPLSEDFSARRGTQVGIRVLGAVFIRKSEDLVRLTAWLALSTMSLSCMSANYGSILRHCRIAPCITILFQRACSVTVLTNRNFTCQGCEDVEIPLRVSGGIPYEHFGPTVNTVPVSYQYLQYSPFAPLS